MSRIRVCSNIWHSVSRESPRYSQKPRPPGVQQHYPPSGLPMNAPHLPKLLAFAQSDHIQLIVQLSYPPSRIGVCKENSQENLFDQSRVAKTHPDQNSLARHCADVSRLFNTPHSRGDSVRMGTRIETKDESRTTTHIRGLGTNRSCLLIHGHSRRRFAATLGSAGCSDTTIEHPDSFAY